jgi:putative membrane protein
VTIETATRPQPLRPRVIQTEEKGRLDLARSPAAEFAAPLPGRRSRSPLAIAICGLAILVLGVVAIELAGFVAGAFERGTAIGAAATAAIAAGAGGLLYWFCSELRSLMRLRSAERLRRAIPSVFAGALKEELDKAAAVLAGDALLAEAVARYRAMLEPHHTGSDALELFSRYVLVPADRLGEAAIRRAAAQAFAINLVSPTVLTDTLLFAVRAMRLIREIAEIYGQHPGVAGTVHLLRRLLGGAGLVGAVDIVGGVLAQQLGGAVLERLSASAAESAYAAQKMARLGLLAMALCRPVGFRQGEAPSLVGMIAGLLRTRPGAQEEAERRREIV